MVSFSGGEMKFEVGDLILIKNINLLLLPRLRSRLLFLPHLRLRPRLLVLPRPLLHLNNTHGIITEAIKHNDAWEGESKKCDNIYIWYSQVDGKEYWFCEDEVDGEVNK